MRNFGFILSVVLLIGLLCSHDRPADSPKAVTSYSTRGTGKELASPITLGDLEYMARNVKGVLNMQHRLIRITLMKDANNAFAYREKGEDYIAFDSHWLYRLLQKTNSRWTVMGVVAHELGHHYFYHITHPNSPYIEEAGADYIAGYALAQLGAPPQTGKQLMTFLADEWGTASHPGRKQRLEAFNRGYQAALTNPLTGAAPPVAP